jgi:mannosylfructose-phosphate synthase
MHSTQHPSQLPDKKHILMLSNHGVHEWNVIPGLTDTGGQNVFVNQFTEELSRHDLRITIGNRGGYAHPVTGKPQKGVVPKSPDQHIIYLEDGKAKFIRKEDMGEQVDELADFLYKFLEEEGTEIDLIISHYWDAALVGESFRARLKDPPPHIWVPHSLGEIKKRNMPKDTWASLRIQERIAYEQQILSKVDRVGSTSAIISKSFREDYDYQVEPIWLPPCVSPSRFYPHQVAENAPIWQILAEGANQPVAVIKNKQIITEVSRTDTTKRKDILIKAFASLQNRHPDTLLAITIDANKEPLGIELMELIQSLGIRDKVAVLGSVWDVLPDLYAISQIYCTPSIMEGFGMSAQEAAATKVPVIASQLVPFATQYLFNEPLINDDKDPYQIGEGAIIVSPDNISGFAEAISRLLTDDQLRRKMGKRAYQITIPRFTWPRVVDQFLQEIPLG